MPTTIDQVLGSVLREERANKGLILRQVHQQSYVSLGYISDVENGHKNASNTVLEQLCKTYEIPVSTLFFRLAEQLKEMGR